MIISPGRQFIFVHIPKTGGTSLALALEARAKKDDILIGDTPKAQRRKARLSALNPRGRLWKHSTLADVEGVVTRAQMSDWCVVTLVRNPWDRAVSYYHWLRAQGFDHPAVDLAKQLTFSAFLNHPHTRHSLAAAPYEHYTRDSTGQDHQTHRVRLEHWKTDLTPVYDHLGFEFDLPTHNASNRPRDYRPFYSTADASLIADIAANDIRHSGYSFD